MPLKHPDFPHIDVMNGSAGEAPKAGAFYAPKHGDNLSSIANALIKTGQIKVARQYDGVMLINNANWNRAHNVYRESSTDCGSKVVRVHGSRVRDGGWKVTKGGFIALCQGSRNDAAATLGLKYSVLWIPSSSFAEPEDVVVGPKVFMPVGPHVLQQTTKPKKLTAAQLKTLQAKAIANAAAAANDSVASYTYASGGTGAQATTTPQESSSKMWLGIAIAVLAAGGILYATTRAGGKRK